MMRGYFEYMQYDVRDPLLFDNYDSGSTAAIVLLKISQIPSGKNVIVLEEELSKYVVTPPLPPPTRTETRASSTWAETTRASSTDATPFSNPRHAEFSTKNRTAA